MNWWKCSQYSVGGCGGGVAGLDTGGAVDVQDSGDLVGVVGSDEPGRQHERAGRVEVEPGGSAVGEDSRYQLNQGVFRMC